MTALPGSALPSAPRSCCVLPTPPPRDILRERGITRDDLLTELGLSPTVVADVEGATDENDLDAALSTCLEWERDAVLGLVAGMSIDEVIEDLDLHVSRAEPDREVSADSDAIIETVRKSDQWIDPRTASLKCGGWTTAVMALLEL